MKRNGLLLTMTFLLLCACHPLTQDSISPTNPTPRPTQIQQTIIQIIEQQEYDTIHWISKEDIQKKRWTTRAHRLCEKISYADFSTICRV